MSEEAIVQPNSQRPNKLTTYSMLTRVLLGLVALLGLLLAVAGAGVTWAHLAIRRERAPLPELDAVQGAAVNDAGPVRVAMINTASQPMPRSGVLDSGRDPTPGEPYVMSHAAFVLEWPDGRLLLVDAGMTRDAAIAFGGTVEMLGGAEPMQALASTAERLGAAANRVQGIVFTHLHTDHVDGIAALCARAGHPIRVFMTEAQDERPNYTTRPGRRMIEEAPCARVERLSGGPLLPLPGFPGVAVIAAGGHTPGSQIVLAATTGADGARRYAFTGDIVNNIDGITHNIPKPFLYRSLVVPEDEERQQELRLFLRRVQQQAGFTLLVTHDQRQLESSGIETWG
jgi:glyoxylase-like metal-dependent hydrolase (beta-lactamase superfamily II)